MWLALDTATDRASIALGGPGAVVAAATIVGARRHASGLLPALNECLSRAGATIEEVEGLVLADGPGSFTGLRVAAAAAKALLHVRPLPLWIAPSLRACAAQGRPERGSILAVGNALRGELFAAAYRFSPGLVEELLPPAVITPGALRAKLPAPDRIVGPAAATLGGEPTWPDAADLLWLVGQAGGVTLVADPGRWEPTYGRPAEAQAQWEGRHGRPLADPSRAPG